MKKSNFTDSSKKKEDYSLLSNELNRVEAEVYYNSINSNNNYIDQIHEEAYQNASILDRAFIEEGEEDQILPCKSPIKRKEIVVKEDYELKRGKIF